MARDHSVLVSLVLFCHLLEEVCNWHRVNWTGILELLFPLSSLGGLKSSDGLGLDVMISKVASQWSSSLNLYTGGGVSAQRSTKDVR